MIPVLDVDLTEEYEEVAEPTHTYAMEDTDKRILGYVDDLEAMKQVVYKILNTERYDHEIYSWEYGVELKDLFGMPVSYVLPELERVITEALVTDDRIDSVDNFSFSVTKNTATALKNVVTARFTVHTVFGDIENEELEVEI